MLISIRRQMNEAERLAARFRTLADVFLGVTAALPKTAVAATPETSRHCKENLDELTAPLKDDPLTESIQEVGKGVVSRVEEIGRLNKAAFDDYDATMKDVVATVAAAVSGFRGSGERNQSSLTTLADGFDALARIEDPGELRRRLREDVTKLRQSLEQMRRENDLSIQQFERKISAFQQRLENARKGSDIDRLTLLGSRRVAERQIQKMLKLEGPVCVLFFDIEGFHRINERHGSVFGDKLLQALAHLLRENFTDPDSLFRWGDDEFLAIARTTSARAGELCRSICDRFAASHYTTYERGQKERVTAIVWWGAAQSVRGENAETLCLRAQENLDLNRRGIRR